MAYCPPLKMRHRRLDMEALRADQQTFSDQYGLRTACLEQAVASLPNASAAEVVADAARRHDAYSDFLRGGRS